MLQDNGQKMTCATDEEIPPIFMDKKIRDKNKLISYLNDMVTSFKEEFKRKDAKIDDLTTQLDRLKEDSLSKEKQLNELLKKKDEKIRQLNERLDNQ